MAVYSNGRYLSPYQVIYLDDTPLMQDQKLEIAYDTSIGLKVCELSFYNVKENKRQIKRPKGKNREDYINRLEKFITKAKNGEFSLEKPIKKIGTKANMSFVYGENIEKKDKIIQTAVDFNGTRKIVKEICLV